MHDNLMAGWTSSLVIRMVDRALDITIDDFTEALPSLPIMKVCLEFKEPFLSSYIPIVYWLFGLQRYPLVIWLKFN
ncbi:MAG: hypothetical protein PHY48_06310 [Candidatus Cloacimonetes bacterium]|nr:hypothetical protein [Candidatus Cloacimonadota bacterium]